MLLFSTGRKWLLAGTLMVLIMSLLVSAQPARAARTCTVRYYISPLTGSGTEQDPIRPLVVDLPSYPHHTHATAWSALYSGASPTTGELQTEYALVAVASTNHRPLLNKAEIGALPDVPLDYSFFDMDWAALKELLVRFDLYDDEMFSQANTWGDFLEVLALNINVYTPSVPSLSTCPLK